MRRPAKHSTPEGGAFLNAVLAPHRSLSPLGFKWVMGVLAAMAFGLGVLFWSMGAWPITLFLIVSVILTWGAFRINYHRARRRERLRLTPHSLIVETSAPGAHTRRYGFSPGHLSVSLLDADEHHSRLRINGAEHSMEIGAFLSPKERAEAAAMLNAALVKWRNPRA